MLLSLNGFDLPLFKRRLAVCRASLFLLALLSHFKLPLAFADQSLTEATGGSTSGSVSQVSHPESSVNSGQLDDDRDLNNDYNGKLDHDQAGRPVDWYPQAGGGSSGETEGSTDNKPSPLLPAANSQPPPPQASDLGIIHSRQVTNNRLLAQPQLVLSSRYGVQARQPVTQRQLSASKNANASSQASGETSASSNGQSTPASFSMRPH